MRRERFEPHLIDLVDYEKDCLYAQAHGLTLPPVPTETDRIGGWSASEIQAMRDNRQAARAIYDRISLHQLVMLGQEQFIVEAMIRGKWQALYVFDDFNRAVEQAEGLRMVKQNAAVRVACIISKVMVDL
ncbi:MAG: hypothetical protein RBT75_09960 [Anaerolineae bacterium]|jgi:hypothetical protein|nr:hypothetical protein [Anaerolineae bacterium]